MTSAHTLIRLPLMGDELAKPLATDLSTSEFVELGWRRFRAGASHTLHCRLGGTPSSFGYLLPEGDDIRRVMRMFEGIDAPQPPPPGSLFGSGCVLGRAAALRRAGRPPAAAQVSAAFSFLSFFSSFGFDSPPPPSRSFESPSRRFEPLAVVRRVERRSP